MKRKEIRSWYMSPFQIGSSGGYWGGFSGGFLFSNESGPRSEITETGFGSYLTIYRLLT